MSTVFRTRFVTRTSIVSQPSATVVSTHDVTHTTQLPARTSYATVTRGTQTIVRMNLALKCSGHLLTWQSLDTNALRCHANSHYTTTGCRSHYHSSAIHASCNDDSPGSDKSRVSNNDSSIGCHNHERWCVSLLSRTYEC